MAYFGLLILEVVTSGVFFGIRTVLHHSMCLGISKSMYNVLIGLSRGLVVIDTKQILLSHKQMINPCVLGNWDMGVHRLM